MKQIYVALLFILFFAVAAVAAIDLNTATKEQLDSLPGIGPVKAAAILKYREEKGPFKTVEQIKEVSGIGEKIFQNIKNEITVGAAPSTQLEAVPVEEKSAAAGEVKSDAAPAKAEENKTEPAAKEPEQASAPTMKK